MADFMNIKYENPKLKQSEIATQLGLSSSTLQRYRNDINMLSPYRNTTNNTNKRTKKVSNANFYNNSQNEPDVKRPQMTSNDLNSTQTKSNKKNKIVLRTGSLREVIELNEHCLDAILHNNNS